MKDVKYLDEHGVEITLVHCQTCDSIPQADVAMIAHQWAGTVCDKCGNPVQPRTVTVCHLPMVNDGRKYCLPVAQWISEPSVVVVVTASGALRSEMHRECAERAMQLVEIKKP